MISPTNRTIAYVVAEVVAEFGKVEVTRRLNTFHFDRFSNHSRRVLSINCIQGEPEQSPKKHESPPNYIVTVKTSNGSTRNP